MANGIFVIQKSSDSVIAIDESRFNPENHVKLASPHGDVWPINTPPVVPARDIVVIEGADDAPKKVSKAPAKKKPAKDKK